MELNKFQHILANNFYAGFEIEACIKNNGNEKNANRFCLAIRKLNNKIDIGYDGSVHPKKGDWSCELRTPVLPIKEAIILLEKIFSIIAELGYTNSSCGFHANFSPIDRTDFDKINPFWLSEQKLWSEIRESFGRQKSKYCKDVVLRSDIRRNPANILKQKIERRGTKNGVFWDKWRGENVSVDYKHVNGISLWRYLIQLQDSKRFKNQKLVKCHWHYANCNLENLKPIPTKDSRIECRSMGNIDYHLRLAEIVDYCDKIIALIKKSYQYKILV